MLPMPIIRRKIHDTQPVGIQVGKVPEGSWAPLYRKSTSTTNQGPDLGLSRLTALLIAFHRAEHRRGDDKNMGDKNTKSLAFPGRPNPRVVGRLTCREAGRPEAAEWDRLVFFYELSTCAVG